MVIEQSDMVANDCKFEGSFIDLGVVDFFLFVLGIEMVQLWDIYQDPEDLSIDLFFDITSHNIFEVILLGDKGH